MLVLSRKKNQYIVCTERVKGIEGPQIVITVLEVRDDKVRLGIEAPAGIAVHRSEVWAEIVAQAQADQASVTVPAA